MRCLLDKVTARHITAGGVSNMTVHEAIEEKWLSDHPEINEQYAGEFIAIFGQEILAHGKNEMEVSASAEKVSTDYVLAYWYPPEEMIL